MDIEKKLLEDLRKTGALLEGHFVLSSGLHSSGYVQCAKLLQYPELASKYAAALAGFFAGRGISAVASPAIGGIVLGHETARHMNARAVFAEKDAGGGMTLRRGFCLEPGEKVLITEDVITTGKSAAKILEIIKNSNAVPEGIACIIDRSGAGPGFNAEFRALTRIAIETYKPGECPLCRQNKPVIKPGSGNRENKQ